jgi:hypothetical protein
VTVHRPDSGTSCGHVRMPFRTGIDVVFVVP